jgi:hypothetical protein
MKLKNLFTRTMAAWCLLMLGIVLLVSACTSSTSPGSSPSSPSSGGGGGYSIIRLFHQEIHSFLPSHQGNK